MTTNNDNRLRLANAAIDASGVTVSDDDRRKLAAAIADTLYQHQTDTYKAAFQLCDQLDDIGENLRRIELVREWGTVPFLTTSEANAFFAHYFPAMADIAWTYAEGRSHWQGRSGPLNLVVAIATTHDHTSRKALQ